MVWGAVIGAGASLLSGAISARAAGKGADAQARAAEGNIREQQRQFNIIDSQLAPFRTTGTNALQDYASLVSPEGQFQYLQDHPLYDYLNKQAADRATDRMIAGGKSYSGQGLQTAQEGMYNLSEGLITNALNRYGGLVDTGLTAATRGAAFRQDSTNAINNFRSQSANARAAGGIAQANAWGTTINELAQLAGDYTSRPKQQKTTSSTPSAGTQLGNYFQTYGYGQL